MTGKISFFVGRSRQRPRIRSPRTRRAPRRVTNIVALLSALSAIRGDCGHGVAGGLRLQRAVWDAVDDAVRVYWGVGLTSMAAASAAVAQEARGPIGHGPVMQGPAGPQPVTQATPAQSSGVAAEQPGAGSGSASPRAHHQEAVQLSMQGSLVDYRKTTVTPNEGTSATDPADQETSSTGYGLPSRRRMIRRRAR